MSARIVRVQVEGGSQHLVPVGTPVMAILGRGNEKGEPILGAVLNNRLVSLATPVRGPSRLQPVTAQHREGQAIYRRSISIVLIQAAHEVVAAAKLRVGQSLGDSYFFEWQGPALGEALVREIEARMRQVVAEDRPFVEEELDVREAIELFERSGATERVRLLKTLRWAAVPVVWVGDLPTLLHGPVAPAAGGLTGFELALYNEGLLLHFPDKAQGNREIQDMPHLFRVYRDTRRWNEIIGVADVGQFNEACISGAVNEVVKVAEGLHEKKVAEIADRVLEREGAKLVLIAGPSSSGKTTFAKRLSVQLRVNGARPVALSLDDYYVDREHTPRDADGKPDFESIEAIDLTLLNEHLERLLKGEKVETPRYDFPTGKRVAKGQWHSLQLAPGDLLLVEGIHGLNERLTAAVPPAHKFRCYVSALTQLTVDAHERVFTSDSRLLRRIVRDRLFRNYRAEKTIEMWPSVRRGETRNIFPFQEQSDAIFNSALVYEPAVLKIYAERFLLEVPTDSPSFPEADRLLKFLSLFVPVFAEEVPQTSILREFIGGSTFSY